MKLFQNSEIRVFKSGISQKSSTVDNMSLIHSLGPPKRISSNIGPILQRCKNFEKLGILFDMKLIETVKYVFQIRVPTKVFHCGYYVLDTLSRSPKRISSNIGPILQISKIFEKLGSIFDMKLIQNSEIRVFKSAIPQKSSTVDNMFRILTLGPPRESVAI